MEPNYYEQNDASKGVKFEPIDDARHFLEAFYSGAEGVPELRRMIWDSARGRYSKPESFFSRDLNELVSFASAGRGDVFHGVATRKPGAMSGKKEDCFETVGIHTDVDFKETPEERFNELLEAFPHKPTIINSSGNGAHCYWLFEKPLRIDDDQEKQEFIEAVNRGVARAFGGDDTHDITRVLRTPGRPNSKYETAPMCRIQSNSGPRYDIHTLAPYAIKAPSGGKAKVTLGAIPEELPERFRSLLAKNKKVQDTWAGERPDLKDQSRSGYDMAMAGLLTIHGFTANEVAAVLKQFPCGKRDDASLAYLEHTISKARPEGGAQRANLDDWPEPEEIPSDLPAVPAMPEEMMPITFRGWLCDIAERMQCPLDFPAIGAVVAAASLIGRQLAIRPKRQDDWEIVPNLWGGIVGRPGIMKTPALAEAMKPLLRLEHDALEKHELQRQDHEKQALIAKAEKQEIEKRIRDAIAAGKATGDFTLPKADELILRRYIVNDSTVEKLGELLNQNPNGLLLFRDELTGWLRTLDREGHENDRAFFLEAWNGNGSYTSDRIGRGTVHIKAACVSVLGGIQPGPLNDYLQSTLNGGSGADGLFQRFQLLVYPDDPGPWENVDRWPDTGAKRRAFEVFEKLNGDSLGSFVSTVKEESNAENNPDRVPFLRFSEDAQELFNEWRQELEKKIRAGDDHPAIEAHLSKYRSLMPSLALVFHVISTTGETGAIPVSRAATAMAAAWCDYLEAHARRIYHGLVQRDISTANLLAKRLQRKQLEKPFSLRDVYRKGWTGLTDPETVERGLSVLEDLAWIRKSTSESGVNGGRPTAEYRISPRVASKE